LGFTLPLPIQKSTAKIASLSIQKWAATNFIVADSEISTKTATLPIQKSVAKTATLPIQKLIARNYVVVDSEIISDGGVFHLYFSFFVCL
jgi:hypothetical protein